MQIYKSLSKPSLQGPTSPRTKSLNYKSIPNSRSLSMKALKNPIFPCHCMISLTFRSEFKVIHTLPERAYWSFFHHWQARPQYACAKSNSSYIDIPFRELPTPLFRDPHTLEHRRLTRGAVQPSIGPGTDFFFLRAVEKFS
ncbi:hypothetical protein TNIN_30181 [Trichonephila inaurata madagascariensis]|uniref:Uncharacterized protein n=1 Tax=Trichonephila inaurata madagascariensis TaxID=2747483 RepID=A0A8X6YG87_9ARAC|nr:hypothetical protein TNIN_30181 [Trichonephila inaurata madagascariensis]